MAPPQGARTVVEYRFSVRKMAYFDTLGRYDITFRGAAANDPPQMPTAAK